MKFKKTTSRNLLQRLKSDGKSGLALDIDDTLSYTDHHWIEQLQRHFSNPENLTRDEIISRYKLIEHVPYWKSRQATNMMKQFMHSNKFQKTIPLIENSNRIIRKIHHVVPIVAYITARPASVWSGTKHWLQKHRFPEAPILFRPLNSRHGQRHPWKANVLNLLFPYVSGIIDDSPDLADELKSLRYQGNIFLFDSGNNTKLYKLHHKVRCHTWDEVYDMIILRYKKHKPRLSLLGREANHRTTARIRSSASLRGV